MSYRRSAYGGIRSRRPVYSGYARARRMPLGRSQYRRAVVPRARVLSRYPAALSGGRGATEMKSTDSQGTASVNIFQLGNVFQIINMPINGAGFYSRIGTRTRAKSLAIFGRIRPSFSNTIAVLPDVIRIMILYDRQANGAAPSVADVLTDYPTTGVAETGSVLHGLNLNNRDRFLVLRDRKIATPGLGVAGVNANPGWLVLDPNMPGTFMYNEFIKLKGLETHYKASTTGAIGDVSTGSFIMLTQCMESAGAIGDSAWTFVWRARFKFFD